MELIKKSIHMDCMKCRGSSQVSLEEDVNIPDAKPDVAALVYEKGRIQIEEVKPTQDHVGIRGSLLFSVLYETKEEGAKLVSLDGKIPFEEQMYLEGVTAGDTVTVRGEIEDLTVESINSRKLSVRTLFTLKAKAEELCDEEAPVELRFEENAIPLEVRKASQKLAQIAIRKNDIFRIREEAALPSNYPNVSCVIWQDISLDNVDIKPMEEGISLQGDLHLFVLYEGEGENMPISAYETAIPVEGMMECHGCSSALLGEITYETSHAQLEVRPDFDGEQRTFGMEVVLDVSIRLYEEEPVEMITDIYGVTKEVECETSETELKQILMRIAGKCKVSERLKMDNPDNRLMQLLHSEGSVQIDRQTIADAGIQIEGTLQVRVLYVTGDDSSPYRCMKGRVPFSYTLEVPGISVRDDYKLHAHVGQLQAVMATGEDMDIKAILCFDTLVFKTIPMDIISEIRISDLDKDKMKELPGMVVYVVRPEDNLWNIGKRYYVPVSRIMEVNELTTSEVKPGDRLLIVV